MDERLRVTDLGKSFALHLQGGKTLPVFRNVDFHIMPGECVALTGPSGIGKSSLLRLIYGNYRASAGEILLRRDHEIVDIVKIAPRAMLDLRRYAIGYVSQFLRVVPRVSTLDIVAEPAIEQGRDADEARRAAAELLKRLNLPERLWDLPPATFSGGEQQRVNIARGMNGIFDLLLLDEPTASLDVANRRVVLELIAEKRAEGSAILAIFHDADIRDQIADRIVEVGKFAVAA